MVFEDLGRISFEDALSVQTDTVARIASAEQQETIYLLEHPNVLTLGRAGRAENVLARKDWHGKRIDLVRTGRGGDVTYHGPGQLVGYPHLDLRTRGRDLGRYLRDLEETLIQTGAHFGVGAFRREGLTGVWTGKGKLASIGVGVRRWVTMHGFALNVNNDLRYFDLIHPCGIQNCPVTSLQELLGASLGLDKIKQVYEQKFRSVFDSKTGLGETRLHNAKVDGGRREKRCVDVRSGS